MAKTVHRLGAASITHDGMTTCGIITSSRTPEGEHNALDRANTVKAVRGTWGGVTCKSCLRNPHAPGGRHSKQIRI